MAPISSLRVVCAPALISTTLCLGSAALFAQIPPSQNQLETGWHVVRPGETLETITAFYLGSSSRWR